MVSSSGPKYDEYQETILRTIVEQHEQEQKELQLQQQQLSQLTLLNANGTSRSSSGLRSDNDGDSECYSDSVTSTSQGRHSHDGGNQLGIGNEKNGFKIAEREDVFVIRMRIIVVLSLVLSSTALALVMYYLAKGEEMNDFRNEFIDLASEISIVFSQNRDSVVDIMQMVGVTTTALSLHQNALWPYYTIPNFEQRTAEVKLLTKSDVLVFSPLVSTNARRTWDTYADTNTDWISDGLAYQNITVDGRFVNENGTIVISPLHIDPTDPFASTIPSATAGPYAPAWQVTSCPSDLSIVNYDLLNNEHFKNAYEFVDEERAVAITKVFDVSELLGSATNIAVDQTYPRSIFVQPLYKDFTNTSSIVGIYALQINWIDFLQNILQHDRNGFICVLKNTCEQQFTFQVNGPNVTYLGVGDLHDRQYDALSKLIEAPNTLKISQMPHGVNLQSCDYYLDVYASELLENGYASRKPTHYLIILFVIFVCTSLVFVLYEILVTRRQNKVLHTAARTHQIVGSLFPEAVRDQIIKEQENAEAESKNKSNGPGFNLTEGTGRAGLRNFFSDALQGSDDENRKRESNNDEKSSKPIADLFPHTTIMFADINGFTAWSSVREPSQVFTLLETVYHGFDQIARARRVFKVETVGDCYVAVAGLPDPRHDHALVMARFARDCVNHMNDLVVKLCFSLGPGTEDLRIRVGLHSGPVTAGVLRGERARFQLFGDTMNTAARMETTGLRNKIHVSQETADLIIEANKKHWIQARKDVVVAKGKGTLRTYWLLLNPKQQSSATISNSGNSDDTHADSKTKCGSQSEDTVATDATNEKVTLSTKNQRLVDWNADLLLQLLQKIIAGRNNKRRNHNMNTLDETILCEVEEKLSAGGSCLQDIAEVIEMPHFNAKASTKEIDPRTIEVGEIVIRQLHDYVSLLASMYRPNPFHCFEHASHVTMSVSKLLGRIVAPDAVVEAVAEGDQDRKHDNLEAAMHDHTYGITSDPLTQFAVILSGLIHDVDHRGVPNFVLVTEDPTLASKYSNKSIAEQNSVDLAWKTLMDYRFEDLRRCIYDDETELLRFRHLVVNSVMATDVFDKELDALRKARWNKAFHEEQTSETQKQNIDRKATIVIEHLIQASDVSHTMQHWHVYQKWNARLFEEMYKAYKDGRTQMDPAEGWYQGELWFFDNYVIPLAKKLKECGVFGVSSDEYLNYAVENRREWEKKGANIVKTMMQTMSAKETSEPNEE